MRSYGIPFEKLKFGDFLAPPFGGAGTALAVPERALSAPFGHLIHFGMIDTGNHGYFDSLRGQLPQRERQVQLPDKFQFVLLILILF